MVEEKEKRASVSIEQEELRGISRTVAEIHWLLLILVLLYLVFGGDRGDAEADAAVAAGLFFYAALVMSFRYANFYKNETRWKIAIETLGMIFSSPGSCGTPSASRARSPTCTCCRSSPRRSRSASSPRSPTSA